MNPEENIERQIDEALKALPEMSAPVSLASRVMAQIGKRAALPWYRQAWQCWPMPLRATSFALLVAVFGALCFGSWELAHTEAFRSCVHRAGEWLAGVNAVWNALQALAGAFVLIGKHLGTGFTIGCILALLVGYGLCLALGTVYFRVGFARRPMNHI